MTDYTELVNNLRLTERVCRDRMDGQVMLDAAAAIEALQAEVEKWTFNATLEQSKAIANFESYCKLKAQLPKQKNLVEVVRCKDCYWNQIQRFGNGKEYCECSRGNSRINNGDWFCPEGEKMEVQDEAD